MYIDSTSYLNASYTSTDETTSSNELESDDFLTLLMAQLENQDPLNPVSDTDMLAELAQFSSVEQLTAMNESMDSLLDSVNALTVNSGISYLGMDVTAEGNTLSKSEDGCSTVYYTLPDDAASLTAYIYNEDGDLVANTTLSGLSAGEHEFVWDGTDYTGDEATDGNYYVAFAAYDSAGESLSVTSKVTGTITGITAESGSTCFQLDDGRLVSMTSISSVTQPSGS